MIRVLVTNIGNATAGASKTRIAVNKKVWIVNTSSLAKGKWVRVQVRWDARKLSGKYTIYGRVDLDNTVVEKREDNNTANLRVKVQNGTVTRIAYSGP
jgi:subtilase family serine protease